MELADDGGQQPTTSRYTSPLRRRQAADTRERIAAAARELFATHGFAGTTIAGIAGMAGVSVQTVYATYGSKGGIVRALLGQFEADADAAGWRLRLEQSTDPATILRTFAQWTRALLSSSKEAIAAAQGAAFDPAMVDLRTEGDRHRRAALTNLVGRIAAAGGLRSDLSESLAVDRAWMLTGVELYLAATGECRWSDSDYEDWLADLLQLQLLEPQHISPAQ